MVVQPPEEFIPYDDGNPVPQGEPQKQKPPEPPAFNSAQEIQDGLMAFRRQIQAREATAPRHADHPSPPVITSRTTEFKPRALGVNIKQEANVAGTGGGGGGSSTTDLPTIDALYSIGNGDFITYRLYGAEV